MLGDIPQTWDEVWALVPGVYSWVQAMPLEWRPDGTPSGALRVELQLLLQLHHNSARNSQSMSIRAVSARINWQHKTPMSMLLPCTLLGGTQSIHDHFHLQRRLQHPENTHYSHQMIRLLEYVHLRSAGTPPEA